MPERLFEGGGRVVCDHEIAWGDDVRIGPNVVLECGELEVGSSVRVGIEDDDYFRHPGGVRIRVQRLTLADGVQIGRETLLKGGAITLGRAVRVFNGATIRVLNELVVDAGGTLHESCELIGVDVRIGRRLWMLPQAKIGGGGALEIHSRLRIGHWAHLGMRTLLNTARSVTIGDEVGLGTGTCLYTHGAYPSAWEGKPVAFGPIKIGDRSWLPGAIVNPGVTIGSDCVIGVGSVVTHDIPRGSLAAGVPARIIKEAVYPRPLDPEGQLLFMREFLSVFGELCSDRHEVKVAIDGRSPCIVVDDYKVVYQSGMIDVADQDAAIILTDRSDQVRGKAPLVVGLSDRRLTGVATPVSERLVDQLRRCGIRFNYEVVAGCYEKWPEHEADVPS